MSSPIPDEPTPDQLLHCQEVIQYSFQDKKHLLRCLTHASAARTRLESNERMEFLGDAILGAAVCEALYEQFPEGSEGELTRIKSVVVSRATCARIVKRMKLEQFLVLGKGITTSSVIPGSVLATAFEAIIGGIYLDSGYAAAKEFIIRVIQIEITRAAESSVGVNYKSLFQQRIQKSTGEAPAYRVLNEEGPDHSKFFQVVATVGEEEFPAAWGPSKKIAEQRAAHNAISQLDGEDVPHPAEFSY
ncbi:ribonuclease III [Planctomicrobium sp.]|jgi:ribonuclease III|nr:ribonuclease III [Planctomicrobium sp.]MDB4439557.1 ribonuclease III [Planctomicrobium sp.]